MNRNIKNYMESIDKERSEQQRGIEKLRQLWELPPFRDPPTDANEPPPVVNSLSAVDPVAPQPVVNSLSAVDPVTPQLGVNSSLPPPAVARIPLPPRNRPPVKSIRRRLKTKTPQNNKTKKIPPWKSSVRGAANLMAKNPFESNP